MREPHARSRTSATSSLAAMDGAVDLARDRELVEACQAGDPTAFAQLYGRYHRRLLRFCVRRLHASDDAEEAVQEAFTRAWRALPRFGGDRRFYPWLTVIAANVCTDMLRRRSRLVPLDEMPARGPDGAPEADVDEGLLRQVDLAMASEALGHLSDRHQRVLRLREATEWTSQRIAEHEGVAVPAVDTLLWRARQAFKREFAALSDTGGLAAALGLGVASLRRIVGRVGTRMAALAAFPTRGPGALVATVAITGAAVAGGGVAVIETAAHPAATGPSAIATTAGTPTPTGSAPAGATSESAGASSHTSWSWFGLAARAKGPSRAAAAGATRPSAVALQGPVGTITSAGASSAAGQVTLGSLGGQTRLARLGTAGAGAVNSVGRMVGTGVTAVGEALGLDHPTPPANPATGATRGSSGSSPGPLSPTALVTTAARAATTVSGAAGTVGTSAGTLTKGLLGTAG